MTPARYLMDSSVWIQVLAKKALATLEARVDSFLAQGVAATTGLIRLEVLSGVPAAEEWHRVSNFFSAMETIIVSEEHWDLAAEIGFRLRRQGITIPNTDLLLGALAIREDVTLVHQAHHFDALALHAGLKVESYLPAA